MRYKAPQDNFFPCSCNAQPVAGCREKLMPTKYLHTQKARMRRNITVIAGAAGAMTVANATANENTRPYFVAPFSCAQVWDASTYCSNEKCHYPNADAIDLAQRDDDLNNISEGEPVLASAAGEIMDSKIIDGGYWINIDHGDGWMSQNIHMELDEPFPFPKGRKVAAGEQLARTSKTGSSTIHQHYSQRYDTDGDGQNHDGRRIRFNGAAINTHEGNKDSYGTWGSDKAEKILSENCAGNFFPGWNQGGVRYHQIYRPENGQTKILKTNANGAAMETVWEGQWTRRWTHFIPFYQKGNDHPHTIVYKSSTGKVSFLRMKLNGAGVTNLSSGTWYKGWTNFAPFTLSGDPYFLAYDSVHGHAVIDKIHPTGDGSTKVYDKNWIKGRTQIVPFKIGRSQYMLLYKGGDGDVKIIKLSKNGNSVKDESVWSGKWTSGYTNIVPIYHEGRQYLFAYKAASGKSKLIKINSGAQGVTTSANMNWTRGWTAFSPYYHNGAGHMLIYKTGSGQAKTVRLKPNGTGVDTVWEKSWRPGWK